MNKLTAINMHLSIIALNFNSLNSIVERHRLAECIEKQDPSLLPSRNTTHYK